jgi:hypothetical protein
MLFGQDILQQLRISLSVKYLGYFESLQFEFFAWASTVRDTGRITCKCAPLHTIASAGGSLYVT